MKAEIPPGVLRDFHLWSPSSIPVSILLLLVHILAGPMLQAASATEFQIVRPVQPPPAQSASGGVALEPGMPIVQNHAENPKGSLASPAERAAVISQAKAAEYDFETKTGGCVAKNRPQALVLDFAPKGMTVRPHDPEIQGNWQIGFREREMNINGRSMPLADAAAARADGRRAVADLGEGCMEWFVNRSEGIEHGYTIDYPEGIGSPTRLTTSFALVTDLAIEADPGSDGILFTGEQDSLVAKYRGLTVRDAFGRELEAHMSLAPATDADPARVTIEVEVAGAAWPVEIDPTLSAELSMLLASDRDFSDKYGEEIDTVDALVIGGAPTKGPGAAYIHENTGESSLSWIERKKLVPPASENPMNGDMFGKAVSFFVNKTTNKTYAIVGAPNHGGTGAIFIYEKDKGGADNWGFVEKYVPDDAEIGDKFGCASDKNSTQVAVGASESGGTGAAYVLQIDDSGATQNQKITPADSPAGGEFASEVKMTDNEIGCGAPGADSDRGKVYLFPRSTINPLLFALTALIFFSAHAASGDRFGAVIILTLTMLAIAGPGVTGFPGGTQLVGRGAVWVYLFSAVLLTWVFFSTLWGSEENGFFGSSLAANRQNDLVVGAIGVITRLGVIAGAAYVFLFNPFLNIFDPPDKVVPSSFVPDGMRLGSAMVLIDTILFLAGSGYNLDMGGIFILQLIVLTLTFIGFMGLFFSQQMLNDPMMANHFREEDNFDWDPYDNGAEYGRARSPLWPEPNTQDFGWTMDGQFRYGYRESNSAGEGSTIHQYFMPGTGWQDAGTEPEDDFEIERVNIGLRYDLYEFREKELPLRPNFLFRHTRRF